MKTLIFITLLGIPFLGFGQLNSTYRLGYDGFVAESFTFKKNGKFDYYYDGCTSKARGKGEYILEDSILTLNFITPRNQLNSTPGLVIKKEPTNKDSVTVRIKVIDVSITKPLIGVVVLVSNDLDNFPRGTITDEEGLVDFNFPKSNDSIYIKTTYTGYPPVTFDIFLDNDYDIVVDLSYDFDKVLRTGNQKQYIVQERTEKRIIMKELYNGMTSSPRYYYRYLSRFKIKK